MNIKTYISYNIKASSQQQPSTKMTSNLSIQDKQKKSWALMAIEADEEEERELKEEQERKLRELIEIRRVLFILGQYEVEDGEILE